MPPMKQDQTTEEKLAVIRLAREELALELEQEQLDQMRAAKLQKVQDRARQKADLLEAARQELHRQSVCTHKKGGQGKDGLNEGDDTKFAVIKHIQIEGTLIVMCQRCQKLWEPAPLLLKREDPAAYKERDRDYQKAIRFPTDNATSGKMLFAISRNAA